MRSRGVVIAEVRPENPPKVSLVKHNHVVETLSAYRSHDSFHTRILLGRPGSDEDLLDAHRIDAANEVVTVDPVPIPKQVAGRGVPRERLDDLLAGPPCGGVLGHVEVDHPAPVVCQNHKDEEHTKRRGRDREEVDRHQVAEVVVEKGAPGLGGWVGPTGNVLRDRRLADLDAEFEQPAVDPRGAPQNVGAGHLADELPDLNGNHRPTWPSCSALPRPVASEATTVQIDHGFGANEMEVSPPMGSGPRDRHPEGPIPVGESWTLAPSFQDSDLALQDEDSERHRATRSEGTEQGEGEESEDEEHGGKMWDGGWKFKRGMADGLLEGTGRSRT